MFDNGPPEGTTHVKIGFNDDGVLTAVHGKAVEGHGVCGGFREDKNRNALMLDMFAMTKCKNVKSEARALYLNTVRNVTHRGYRWGFAIVNMAFEAISAELGMDPVEVILKNIHTTEPSLKACIDAGKTLIDWNWHPANSKRLPNGRMHGLAAQAQVQARFGSRALIYMYLNTLGYADGKVYIPLGVPDIGVAMAESIAMVVAEELGARYEDVIANYAQYDPMSPNRLAFGSYGPCNAFSAKEAALDMKEMVCKAGAAKLKVTPEEVDTKDSTVYVKADLTKSIAFDELGPFFASYDGAAVDWPGGIKSVDEGDKIYTMNAMFCEVEVDTDTGQVEIINLPCVPDAGKMIRPQSWENQLEGLLIWTIGQNMTEEYIWDKESGVLLNGSALEYKIPTLLDCDRIEHTTVETRSGGGAYGSVGIAEFVHSYVMVALAVHNAIGKWVSPPLTPDKVLAALGKA